jgi:hypothetical protein
MLNPNDSSQASSRETAATTSLQPMRFTDILDTMFSLYRNHFRQFSSIVAIYFVLLLGLNLLTGTSTFSFASSGQSSMAIAIALITSPIAFVVTFFVGGGLMFASAEAYLDRHITVRGAFSRAKRRFWPYLGSNFLWCLVVGILTITIIGIPFAIYFGTRWVFCSLAALVEENSAKNALRRSSELVKGTWWRVFGITLAILLLALVIQTILQFSLLFVFGVTQAIGGQGDLLEMLQRMIVPELTTWDGLATYVIHQFINIVVTSLTLPIAIIGFTLLYFDLRIRKEGFDIEMRVTNETV